MELDRLPGIPHRRFRKSPTHGCETGTKPQIRLRLRHVQQRRVLGMATTLKKTNVVIIGLGAAGGVACLPLAQAGLEVVGLEAGSWLDTKDMSPDELKLNRGLWPPGPQKTKIEGLTSRPNASQAATRANHPM